MAYQTPKTNWLPTDYFNIGDYNRIIGNIAFIKELASEVYPLFQYNDMGENKTYNDYLYADEMNAIENNLTLIVQNTFPFIIGEEKTYYENQTIPDYVEFNRIESAIKLIHDNILGQIGGRKTLSFILGGSEF